MSRVKNGENKRKHLEMIQGVINRMASNQFLFKGWSITLIAAIATFSANDNNPALMSIPIVATLLFWFIDAYYLMLERAFRNLYDDVVSTDEDDIDFKMKISEKGVKFADWLRTLWRPVLALFYGATLIALIILILALNSIWLEITIHHGS
jgi:uncharacterized membrane protein SpoIIM required for sporulation